MSKKYRVINNYSGEDFGLKVGDIVTNVEASRYDNLYELPKHLHGRGHTGKLGDSHLKLKENNYLYIDEDDLEEIEELENEIK